MEALSATSSPDPALRRPPRAAAARWCPSAAGRCRSSTRGSLPSTWPYVRRPGCSTSRTWASSRSRGRGALAFLQRVTSNDVARLRDGQAQYSALPNAAGAPLDDVILYRRAPERYLHGGQCRELRQGLGVAPVPGSRTLHPRRPERRLCAPRPAGPACTGDPAGVDRRRPRRDRLLSLCRRYAARRPARTIARTGYTGEDGFEIFVAPEHAEPLWRRLVDAGKDRGLLAAGLGARDTLRLEARICLYGNDIDETTTLVEAGLGWIVARRRARASSTDAPSSPSRRRAALLGSSWASR